MSILSNHPDSILFIFAFIFLIYIYCLPPVDGKLSPLEKSKIKDLRERFYQSLANEKSNKTEYDANWITKTSDPLLFNWAEYYNFDLNETERNLKKSLDWRRTNNIDNVINWKPPANFEKLFPFIHTGFTDDGEPVYYANIGRWDPSEVFRAGMRRELFQYVVYVVERAVWALEKNNEIRRNNSLEDAGNFVMFGDVEGVRLSQVASINVLGFVASSLGALQFNYPFFHKVGIAINTPAIVSTFLDVTKSVLSSRTFDRLFIYSTNNDKWRSHVLKVAPKSAIPVFMGGEFKL